MENSNMKYRAANKILISLLLLLLVTAVVAQDDLRLDGGEEMGWDAQDWRVQVDGVMGGQSDGSLDFDDDSNIMVFTGDIVLDGGGFSSVRKRLDTALDLSGYAGVVVELKTSRGFPAPIGSTGSPLGLHLQLHDRSSQYGYASAFAMPLAPETGTETSVFLPLESFDRATRMGWVCRQEAGCVLDSTSIDEIDVYVLFQEGIFEVRLKSITAVAESISFPSPVIDISSDEDLRNLITDTMSAGGALYDYGYGELCIATYRSTVNSILAASGTAVTETMKSMACQGLERADGNTEDKIEAAWTLRGTLDSILEALGGTDAGAMSNGWRPTASTAWSNLCVAVTSFPPVNVQGLETGDASSMNLAIIGNQTAANFTAN